MPALGSPCKARGAPEYDAPNGGSLDADSAKIGARQHLSMRSIGRALGDAHAARRRSAQAVAARFQECESMIALLLGRTMTRDANRTLLGKRGTFGNSGRGCDDAVGAGQIANLSQAFRPDARRDRLDVQQVPRFGPFLHLPGLARPSNPCARSVAIIFLAAAVTGWIMASLMPAPPNGLLLSSLLAGDRHPTLDANALKHSGQAPSPHGNHPRQNLRHGTCT